MARSLLLIRPRRLLVVSGVAGLLICSGALFVGWSTSVVIRDVDGRVVSRFPLPDSGDFGIEYVHSYYGAPATEHFSADSQGSFELVGISSPSEAVLDYYELEGRKIPDGERVRLVPTETRRFEELPLVGTVTGRKTLVLPDHRMPLFTESGSPAHLTIRVEEDTLATEMLGG